MTTTGGCALSYLHVLFDEKLDMQTRLNDATEGTEYFKYSVQLSFAQWLLFPLSFFIFDQRNRYTPSFASFGKDRERNFWF